MRKQNAEEVDKLLVTIILQIIIIIKINLPHINAFQRPGRVEALVKSPFPHRVRVSLQLHGVAARVQVVVDAPERKGA